MRSQVRQLCTLLPPALLLFRVQKDLVAEVCRSNGRRVMWSEGGRGCSRPGCPRRSPRALSPACHRPSHLPRIVPSRVLPCGVSLRLGAGLQSPNRVASLQALGLKGSAPGQSQAQIVRSGVGWGETRTDGRTDGLRQAPGARGSTRALRATAAPRGTPAGRGTDPLIRKPRSGALDLRLQLPHLEASPPPWQVSQACGTCPTVVARKGPQVGGLGAALFSPSPELAALFPRTGVDRPRSSPWSPPPCCPRAVGCSSAPEPSPTT